MFEEFSNLRSLKLDEFLRCLKSSHIKSEMSLKSEV